MVARALLALALASGAVLVAVGAVEHEDAAVVAGLLVLAALVLVVPVGSVKKISLGGLFDLELTEAAQAVAAQAPAEEQEKDDLPRASEAVDLRLRLEAKLTYIAKHLLGEAGRPTFITIGSLKYDGYLTAEEAAVAAGILTLRDEELETLPAANRRALLTAAEKVVSTIRASVLHGWVRTVIEQADGWGVEERERGAGKRPDLLASGPGGETVLVLPAFATSHGSKILRTALRRVERGDVADADRRLVVLPRESNEANLDPEGDPAVIRMQDLGQELVAGD